MVNAIQAKSPLTQQGFGYLTILFLVLAISVSLGVATERIDTILKREKEQDLLFIGQQYQQALTSYYHQSPDGFKSLPTSLEELTADKRFIATKRHLRKLYPDPITNSTNWGVLRNPQNQITAVYSLSNEAFLKLPQTFQTQLGDAASIRVYSDLKFQYQAKAQNSSQQNNDQMLRESTESLKTNPMNTDTNNVEPIN